MTIISFARGAPSLDMIDIDGLKKAAHLAFDNDPSGTTAYGSPGGYAPLREWIANKHNVSPDQVLVTNGSMQADSFLFELFVEAGDAVIVESPTYDRTLENLRKHGADLHPIRLEDDGLDTKALETLLPTISPKLAHIIPNFQNPAGCTLSAAKRQRLLELAEEHDFTIFEDDPYIDTRFDGDPLPTMLSQDKTGRVVYASSFSKTICPGVRIGYLIGPQDVIAQAETLATDTYITPNMLAQSIVYQFVSGGGMTEALMTVRIALRERRDATVKALRRELPEAKFADPQGGYFVWVELPETVDVAELEKAGRERDVLFIKGVDFVLHGGRNSLRLAYAGLTPRQIDEGITRLAEAVGSLPATTQL